MSKLKMNCGYCGRKCDLDKDFCIPQDSVYVCKSCYTWQQKVTDLEAKLAEKEEQIERLKTLNKSLNSINEDLHKRLDLIRTSSKKDYIKNMEQQLAEKDDEIEKLNNKIASNSKWLKSLDKQFVQIRNHNQDKIELLEKVKAKIKKAPITDYDTNEHFRKMYQYDCIRIIDTLISDIKGENK